MAETNLINVLGQDPESGVATWVSGGVFHSNTTISCDAVNGTMPIRSQSATLCVNLNADLLDGKNADDILSSRSLRKIVDAVNLLLRDRGAGDADIITIHELEQESKFTMTLIPTFAGFGETSHSYQRDDRNPNLSTSDLVARSGGNPAANGTSTVPQPINRLVGYTAQV